MGLPEAIVAILGTIGAFTVAGLAIDRGIRHEARKRELEHIERIRAFELGRVLPQDVPRSPFVKIGAALAIAVPIASLFLGALASQVVGYHETIWRSVSMIGVAAVVCGSVLVMSSISKATDAIAKPHVEEDAYDVVSSRG